MSNVQGSISVSLVNEMAIKVVKLINSAELEQSGSSARAPPKTPPAVNAGVQRRLCPHGKSRLQCQECRPVNLSFCSHGFSRLDCYLCLAQNGSSPETSGPKKFDPDSVIVIIDDEDATVCRLLPSIL